MSAGKMIREYVARLVHEGRVDPSLSGIDLDLLANAMRTLDGTQTTSGKETPVSGSRWQDAVIESEIPSGASVLDLGCGGGALLERLINRKFVRGQGVELDIAAVASCIDRGVPVIQVDLDEGLRGFSDGSFDYVVMEETLPTVHKPMELLKEMLRVGRCGIVSFPNFAHWRVRFDLLVQGRMPVTKTLPAAWYESSNIRLFTLGDFMAWAEGAGVEITRSYVFADGRLRDGGSGDSITAEESLVVVKRKD